MAAIFSTIDAAGLTSKEAATLFKVCRATLYNWKLGTPPKTPFVYENAERVSTVIAKAIELKRLPLDPAIKRSERMAHISRVLREVYQSLQKN